MSKNVNFSRRSEKNLLRLHASVLDELKRRGIIRTKNNPLGDYTEWLVSKALGLELATKSAAGYDAKDRKGTRFQIKGRRVTADNPSRQLSAIRNFEAKLFDYLLAVIFDADFNVIEAVQIPHKTVHKYATYRKYVNGHILHLRGDILNDSAVISIRELNSTH